MNLSHEDRSLLRDLNKFTGIVKSISELESIDDYFYLLRSNNLEAFEPIEKLIGEHDFRFKDSSTLSMHFLLGMMELIADGKIVIK